MNVMNLMNVLSRACERRQFLLSEVTEKEKVHKVHNVPLGRRGKGKGTR